MRELHRGAMCFWQNGEHFRTLDETQSSQSGGQSIQTAKSIAECIRKGVGQTRRPRDAQLGGQYAGGEKDEGDQEVIVEATKKTAKVAKRKAAPKNAAAKKTSAKTPAKAPRKSPSKSATKTASTRTAATSKSAGAKPTKDPKGGLTAAGRAAFAKSQGSHLKPGIKKPMSAMTPMEMKRKGSWAVRFFARDPLPPLVDKAGSRRALPCPRMRGANQCPRPRRPPVRSRQRVRSSSLATRNRKRRPNFASGIRCEKSTR